MSSSGPSTCERLENLRSARTTSAVARIGTTKRTNKPLNIMRTALIRTSFQSIIRFFTAQALIHNNVGHEIQEQFQKRSGNFPA
jgi:hypothetical protein